MCGFFSLFSQIWEFLCIPYTQSLIWYKELTNVFMSLAYDIGVCWQMLGNIGNCIYVFCIFIVGHLVCLFYKYLWHVGVLFSVLLCHIICMASFNFFSNMGVPLCVLHLHGGRFGVPLKKYIFDNTVCFLVCLFVNIFVWLLFSFSFKYGSSFAFLIHKKLIWYKELTNVFMFLAYDIVVC